MKTIQGNIVRLNIHSIPIIPCRGYEWSVHLRSGL